MVILIVLTSRRMQTVTNYFIANLALADVVIGLFSIPFQFQVQYSWSTNRFKGHLVSWCANFISLYILGSASTAMESSRFHVPVLSVLSGNLNLKPNL